MTSASRTIWSIQYLRALAAFGVIVFHSLDATPYAFPFGAIGIHLFFVISGFLMWTTTYRKNVDIAQYAASRIKRIAPLYWFATILTLVLSMLGHGFFWQASWQPLRVIKSLLFIPQTGIEGGIYPVVYQGWTLQYEMFFYALFGACLLLPLRSRLWTLTAIIGSLALIGIAFPQPDSPVFSTYTSTFCLEFLSGAWAARLCTARSIPPAAAMALILAGAPGLWLSDHFDEQLGNFGWLTTSITTCAIIIGAVCLEQRGRMPRIGWLKFGGEASYSLYLFQVVGFFAASQFSAGWPVLARALAYCLCAVATGIVMYVLVERPLQRLMKSRTSSSSAPLAA